MEDCMEIFHTRTPSTSPGLGSATENLIETPSSGGAFSTTLTQGSRQEPGLQCQGQRLHDSHLANKIERTVLGGDLD